MKWKIEEDDGQIHSMNISKVKCAPTSPICIILPEQWDKQAAEMIKNLIEHGAPKISRAASHTEIKRVTSVPYMGNEAPTSNSYSTCQLLTLIAFYWHQLKRPFIIKKSNICALMSH